MAAGTTPGMPADVSSIAASVVCSSCKLSPKEVVFEVCGHSVCSKCASGARRRCAGGGGCGGGVDAVVGGSVSVGCPVCSTESLDGVNLTTDFVTKGIIAFLEECGVTVGTAVETRRCTVCGEVASLWCQGFGDICGSCSSGAQSLLKIHKAVPLQEHKQPPLCKVHKGKKPKYFCETCAKLVCTDCEHDQAACQGHKISVISKVVENKKQKVRDNVAPLEREAEWLESTLVVAKQTLKEVMATTDLIVRQLADSEKKIHELVSQKFKELTQKTQDIARARIHKIQTSIKDISETFGKVTAASKVGRSICTTTDNVEVLQACGPLEKAAYTYFNTSALVSAVSATVSQIDTSEILRAISSLPLPAEKPTAIQLPTAPGIPPPISAAYLAFLPRDRLQRVRFVGFATLNYNLTKHTDQETEAQMVAVASRTYPRSRPATAAEYISFSIYNLPSKAPADQQLVFAGPGNTGSPNTTCKSGHNWLFVMPGADLCGVRSLAGNGCYGSCSFVCVTSVRWGFA
eukprot:TRINITY_DN1065_c0_g1_i1.p1 TRINITY_DN1065_c0_g1~~TRINITY_DN1065_c0_g1_i1.p1  ORF type:complete len:518 (-),score=117.70 TRINITY_DN1065_c0_g1_i1:29-1582(-)